MIQVRMMDFCWSVDGMIECERVSSLGDGVFLDGC